MLHLQQRYAIIPLRRSGDFYMLKVRNYDTERKKTDSKVASV